MENGRQQSLMYQRSSNVVKFFLFEPNLAQCDLKLTGKCFFEGCVPPTLEEKFFNVLERLLPNNGECKVNK